METSLATTGWPEHNLSKRKVGKRDLGKRPQAAVAEFGRVFPTVKAITILEALATSKRPLSVPELGARLGIPKPTAHRIVRMLKSEGLLQREAGSSRYMPGNRLVRLGLDIVGDCMLRAPRHAILEALSRKIGESCNIGVMAGSHVEYLDRVEAAWPFGLHFEPGSKVPLHCTAMGKLFLSLLPPQKGAFMLRSISLHRYTENTITSATRLEAELERIRSKGVSTDNQEFLAGCVCVAVPIRGPSGQQVAALAVSAPLARMSLEQGLAHVPLLEAAAQQVAATIFEDDADKTNGPGKSKRG
jgi:DNA-binding IclR family transcriptional regulator